MNDINKQQGSSKYNNDNSNVSRENNSNKNTNMNKNDNNLDYLNLNRKKNDCVLNCLIEKNSIIHHRRKFNNRCLFKSWQINDHHLNCYKLIKFIFILSLFTSQFLVQNVEAKKFNLKGRNLEYFCR
jgi:hypothetical protein